MEFLKPETEWRPPSSFPDLTNQKEIAIDLETCDPNLTSRGSGWPRKDGYVIGIAVAVDGAAWYFPIRHDNGSNIDAKQTLRWLADVCSIERDYML